MKLATLVVPSAPRAPRRRQQAGRPVCQARQSAPHGPATTLRGIDSMEVPEVPIEMQGDLSSREHEVRSAPPWPPPGMRGVH